MSSQPESDRAKLDELFQAEAELRFLSPSSPHAAVHEQAPPAHDLQEVQAIVSYATYCKDDGNNEMKQGKNFLAVPSYREGLRRTDPVRYHPLVRGVREALLANLTLAYDHLRDDESAINAATLLLSENGTHIKGLLRRGRVYGRLGKLEEAEMDFAKALSLDPSLVCVVGG
ncbi:unnamed protein product [Vitrella brassicaformis CCMP3155]|uniref:peptidylprolyl isomerase n=1 Tax=Vitrella brassicaformis (strain CCMP3155) TaxID=1169540 RepID=A0A0G4ED23_VITBC|nr:unnamed protein product [Vitrella brassicaformis CCMP3155]|eukprot:CEL93895.1 unnamed protein product [Vitrella brassicaformis CCMP3155]